MANSHRFAVVARSFVHQLVVSAVVEPSIVSIENGLIAKRYAA